MPLSKKRNRDRMKASRATCVQPEVVQPVQPEEGQKPPLSYNRNLDLTPKQEKLASLRQLIATSEAPQSNSSHLKEESNSRLPLYNKRIHKPGDKVIKDGKEVIVQEVDGDGNVILEL